MKKTVSVVICLLMICLSFAALAEVSFPAFGACTGEQVNVREQPNAKVPSLGTLIRNAPIVVFGESEDGSCWRCATVRGEGYLPKQYVEIFEDMTAEEFEDYCAHHPNAYRKLSQLSNSELLDRYYDGTIGRTELKEYWHREPGTGYYGWLFDPDSSDGIIFIHRDHWWWWNE